MDLPSREALLDIDWLVRTQTAEGAGNLASYLRRGAEVYGGPVTAVAEAVLSPRVGVPLWRADTDVRHALAIKLLAGSWSPDPAGPRRYRPLLQVHLSTFPAAKRAEFLQKRGMTDLDPVVPDINQLRLIEPLDRAWVGHTDGIWACDVSPDGRWVISTSRDGDVSVWDMDAGTLVARARTGTTEIRDCAVTPDGRRLITVHRSGRVTVWDLPTLSVVAMLEAPRLWPFDPDDEQAAYDYLPKASPHRWRRFAVSPDSRRLALAGWNAVEIWDLERFSRDTTLAIESGLPPGLIALFFASDTVLKTIGRGATAPVLTWDVPAQRITDTAVLTMPGAETVTTAVATVSGHVVTASYNETAVWHLDNAAPVATVPYGIDGRALAVSMDGRYAATSSHGELQLWSLPNLTELHRWHLSDFGLWDISCALAFVPGGRHLIVAGWEGVLRRVVLPG
jgi:WD40 repeat protein